MASLPYRASFALFFLGCLTLLLVPISASKINIPHNSGSEKVTLDYYYESLCPGCVDFIVNDLVKLFDDDLISIVDFRLYPWGNSRARGNGTYICQHGPPECLLDTVEACVIHAWPDANDHFPLILCIEKLVYDAKYDDWESCLGSDAKIVKDCYDSGLGAKLELQYAAMTDALEPPHRYTPWVVVNGQPLYEDYENFVSYICEAYKGTLPKACGNLSMGKSTQSVCYKEIPAPTISSTTIEAVMAWIKKMATSM